MHTLSNPHNLHNDEAVAESLTITKSGLSLAVLHSSFSLSALPVTQPLGG